MSNCIASSLGHLVPNGADHLPWEVWQGVTYLIGLLNGQSIGDGGTDGMQGHKEVADGAEVPCMRVLPFEALPSGGASMVEKLVGRDDGRHLGLRFRVFVQRAV